MTRKQSPDAGGSDIRRRIGGRGLRRWRLGFKQSGLRHITRALRGSTFDASAILHAFPPCCCPLALSRPGQAGDPEASSFRTSTLCEE